MDLFSPFNLPNRMMNPKQHWIEYQILCKSDNKLDLIYKNTAPLEYYKAFPKPEKKVRFSNHLDIQEYYIERSPIRKVRKSLTL